MKSMIVKTEITLKKVMDTFPLENILPAVDDGRSIEPAGWHVAKDEDFT
jgi:hypothetical protein